MEYSDTVFSNKLNDVQREILIDVDEKFFTDDALYNELQIIRDQKIHNDELMAIYHI